MAGPVSTGSILGETFRIVGRGAGTVLGVSLVVHSPVLLAVLFFFWHPGWAGALQLLQLATSYLLAPIASAALIHAVFQLARERDASVGESLRVALSRFWAVVGLSILVGLAAGIATLACIVPGLIVQAGLFVAIPALIVERLRVSEAFNRSWRLTDGYKFSTFGVGFLLGLLLILCAAGLMTTLLVVLPGTTASPGALERLEPATARQNADLTLRLYNTGVILFTILATTLQATAATIAYRQLRETKDGLEDTDLLAVFD